ncbi:phosphoribosylglycinamide formyltransferase [Chryseobacterium carnipullorum]|uniref:Phosphoribosylglycinamide formyltransferase n=1 Tax=Chryseobacterium carnipullorum TaxID=1124835 RepID=A0A376E4F3_CHRCU|nr:phosphoribosylglycinamide formyltransferase [Chryseobacterium carnipullorum]AZA50774.1 phosphoribosylglycinamide formyltransferase [Chryseobacterium carnipullorum]AZA65639.1 phosphoribosylglycinamide formyltransferase [Chryseobacterium carnipullorum]STD01974.1 Phosphoribosylglycinamide formyltransferase [Chryseobacterium carnipullorum]
MKNIVILVSGSGTNLQRIIDTIDSGEIQNAKVSLVVADRECYGLERAKNHHIDHVLIPRGKNFSNELGQVIPKDTDLIVLAGFLSILKPEFCVNWTGKIINIHPALLPKFGGKGMWGMHVHNAVIEAGEKESGATVHFVTPGIDEGEAILQKSFEVTAEDTPETIAEKVHHIEYEIFPKAINKVLGNNS